MKKLLIALFAISLILGFASCKSTEQEEPVETPVEQPTEEPTEEPVEEPTEEPAEPESFAEKNAALLEKIDGSRADAVKAGADKYYADQLAALDAKLAELKDKAANSNEDMSAELEDLNYRYLALVKVSETKQLKEKIEEHGFDQDNKVAYDAAEVLLADLEKLFSDNADGKHSKKLQKQHTLLTTQFSTIHSRNLQMLNARLLLNRRKLVIT